MTSLTPRFLTTPALMKATFALILLLAAAPSFAQTADGSVAEPDLRAELAERFAADQDVRMRLISAGGFVPDSMAAPSPALAALFAEANETDADNLAFVEALIAEHGWPTPTLVGPDGVSAVFYIVQHSDLDVQERMLPLAEAAWQAGDFAGHHYAMLLDRTLVHRGKLQIYGTQAGFGPDGEFFMSPVADEAQLDARRAEMGLPPMDEYVEMMRQVYQVAPSEG